MEKAKTAVFILETVGVVCLGVSFVIRGQYGLGEGVVGLLMRSP